MLTHKPVNRYLASKDAESAGAAAPDGASPRRLRTPPLAKDPQIHPDKMVELGIFGFRCIDLQPGCSQKISTAIFSSSKNIAVLISSSIQNVLP